MSSAMSVEREGDTYVARNEAGVLWRVELRLDMTATPFREEIVWTAASVIAVGGGRDVHFLAAESGKVVRTLALDHDLFGHFGPADSDVLYVLGWQHVVALDRTLEVRWISRDVAVDGIVYVGNERGRLQLSAQLDPPDGWVDV